jgi:hypothetical protein
MSSGMPSQKVALLPLVVLSTFAVAACSTSAGDSEIASGDDEVVSSRLSCVVDEDPCKHGSDGDLEACVDAITLRQATGGLVRLEIKKHSTIDDPEGNKTVRLTSDAPASLTGNEISAAWEEGEYSIELKKVGSSYEGEITLEQDFAFKVKCTSAGSAAGGCDFGGKHYAVGETFPDADGCNTCTCSANGIACTELACAPSGCSVGGQHYNVGERFSAPDGCNTCTCQDGGYSACTEIACL